ncbi:MAG: hypothetical protein NT049_13755, partial [Planctomycetota bacterium]|nr:hypothetical protein [Planctomycetota bacterium]
MNKQVLIAMAAGCLALLGFGADSHAQERAKGRLDPSVFDGPPAAFAPDIFGSKQKTGGVLRVLTVDERMGHARKNELVRVPLFFHAAEAAADANGYVITPVGGGAPVPYQADDIRRDASGKIARMHVYFVLGDLPAWGRKQWELSAGKNPGASLPALPVTESAGKVALAGDEIKVLFHTSGKLAGAIAGIETPVGKVALPEQNLAPATTLIRQDMKQATVRENEINFYTKPDGVLVKDLRWAGGPLMAKLVLRVAPAAAPTDIAEYLFMIPKHGSELVETELFYPEEKDSADTVGAKGNAMLTGKLFLGDAAADQQIVSIPAGLRKEFRAVHKQDNKALVNAKAGISLAAIPYTQQGAPFAGIEPDGRVFFCGAKDFQTHAASNSGTLRVFWGQVRYLFSSATAPEDLWRLSVRSFQPLTAVVDEPWAKPADFIKFAREVAPAFWDIKNWGRPFQATLVMNYLTGKNDAAAAALAKFAAGGEPTNVTPQGWPYVKSFANAFNMHVGTYLLGLWGARKTGNAELAHWVLDATQNPSIQGVYGHGQRPYTMNAGNADGSDALYQFVSDFWLRAIELTCNEDLSLPPSIYGKYFDAIDVNSDRYQRRLEEKPDRAGAWWRATFLRTQSHDHRWEAWSVGPYIGMLANASDGGAVGVTEACYYMQRFVGKPIGYNELMVVFMPEVLLGKAVGQYKPAPRPALPANIQVKPAAGKNVITWDAVKGETAGYRIYRAETAGGMWTWVNSPWAKTAAFVPPTEAQRPKAAKRNDPPPTLAPGVKPYEMKIPQVPDTLVKGTSFTD